MGGEEAGEEGATHPGRSAGQKAVPHVKPPSSSSGPADSILRPKERRRRALPPLPSWQGGNGSAGSNRRSGGGDDRMVPSARMSHADSGNGGIASASSRQERR